MVKHGVTIVGYTDLPSRLAKQSSTLYATNLFRLAEELCKTKDGVINVNMDDDAIRGADGDQGRQHHLAAAAAQAACARRPSPPRRLQSPAKAHGHGAGRADVAGAR